MYGFFGSYMGSCFFVSVSSRKHHLLATIHTSDMDTLRCSHRVSAARADIFAAAGCSRRDGCACVVVCSCSRDRNAVELVARDENIRQLILQDELNKVIAR